MPRQWTRHSLLTLAGTVGFLALVLLALSNCGASVNVTNIYRSVPVTAPPNTTPQPTATTQPEQPTATARPDKTPNPTATPQPRQTYFAYLYSRVDYPLQVPVNSGDTVTLTLAPDDHVLQVTPAPGQGSGQAVPPIPLPTDLAHYQDIGVAANTTSDGTSPLVWQLTSAPRQSLLTTLAGKPAYVPAVSFKWHVAAIASGQNLVKITISLYFRYLDGSEHDGAIEVTQSPIPIVAVQPTPLNTTLPPYKLPLLSLTTLGGIIGLARFLFSITQKINTVTTTAKDVATTAGAIRHHFSSPPQPPTQKRQPPNQRP